MRFKKCHYRSQVDMKDCGVATLAMILEYYGSYYSLATLREMAKTTQDGTTALGLVKVAEALHFNTQAIQADMSLFDVENLSFPFIAHVIKNETLLHYYTVIGCDKKNIHIADPDSSVRITKMSRKQFEKEWTGVTLFFTPSNCYKPYKEKTVGLWSFVPVLKKQKLLISQIIGATLFITFINISGSYYLQAIIDNYIPNQMFHVLGIISIGLIIGYTIQQLVSYVQSQLLMILGQRLSIEIILSYIKHVLYLPLSFFSTRRTGEIVSRFTDANAIIEALASTVLSVFLDVSVAIIVAVILCLQHPLLFLISILSLPIYTLIVFLFMKPFERMNQEVMETNAKLSSSIIEDINGIETLKALSSEDTSYQKIDKEFTVHLKKSFTYYRSENIQKAIKTLLHLLLNVFVLWTGSKLVMSNQMTLGQLITFNTMLVYFTNPLENIVNLQTKLQKAHVANARLNEVYQIKSEFLSQQPMIDFKEWKETITFTEVSFRYGYGAEVLSKIDFTIQKGSKVAFVGISGSGKTTLAKLLVNFYEPTHGEITLDHINLKKIDKKSLRHLITYLPQQPYIFNGTILENLLLGAPKDTTQNDIIEVLNFVELNTDISRLPMQLQTELTSDGTELSGGQKQRIALARALLTKSPILILDEATSSLDVLTEKKIIDNLLALDKTIIFIAHRLTIAERADRIIVLDKGQLIEDGPHETLLKKGAFYTHLINS
ncbi:peptide cleavage/export ABC transporter [Enterococcus gallinarum]|uniref:peptide cleavage/export ABC transporter n=1 Tax=Enterococcus gallinarum TaxID=1353 RepID=UPI0020910818|nr:peptide cleavage/export ABC transporter [Enterococcus gallinarum]MCO5478326.1 peptide cleavage/export ABC transporter [Enterococcus gallinarum]